MFSERIEFVKRKFGPVFSQYNEAIFFNPETPSQCLSLSLDKLVAYQTFFPVVDQLEKAGVKCVQSISQVKFNLAIISIPKSKKLAKHLIYLATKVVPEGLIVVDGNKSNGINSIIRDLEKKMKVTNVISKAHGKTAWFETPADLEVYKDIPIKIEDGFETQAGVFSSDGVDPASKLLIQLLPRDLTGVGADLGGGWGYLSAKALETNSIRELHFIEADFTAINLAKNNLNDNRVKFYWCDALKWKAPKLLDFIIMNPPFHHLGRAMPTLGVDFIKVASRNLKKSGILWLVANRHLPYEDAIQRHFSSFSELSGSKKFKVIRAENPINF
jgi:16S rRNA (guanine1207-N2)-methyltransferase